MTPKGRNLEIKKIRSLSRGNDGLLGSKESSQTNLLNITLQAEKNNYYLGTPNSFKLDKSKNETKPSGSFVSSSSHASKSYAPSINSTRSKLSCKSPRQFAMLQKPGTSDKIQKVSFTSNQAIVRFSYSTKAGVKERKTKENQDSLLINPKMLGYRILHLFGVCDGHGDNGKKASESTQIILTRNIANGLSQILQNTTLESIPSSTIVEILRKATLQTNQEVVKAAFNTLFSGTTCCCAFFFGNKCYMINVGDSRAIVVKLMSGQYIAKPLTKDHKPDDFEEQKRIVASGGKVQPFFDLSINEYCGPQRVYNLKGEVPGLAMSRSIGDQIAKRYGVIADPQINVYELQPEDKYIVIGSDGIWEFLDNQRVADISSLYMRSSEPEIAVKKVMKEAIKAWKKNEEYVVDDISCIILQLDSNQESSESSTQFGELSTVSLNQCQN